MKKVNFILFAIFFASIIAWIGVFTWDYFRSLKEPPLPPSAVDNSFKAVNSDSCEKKGGIIENGDCVFPEE